MNLQLLGYTGSEQPVESLAKSKYHHGTKKKLGSRAPQSKQMSLELTKLLFPTHCEWVSDNKQTQLLLVSIARGDGKFLLQFTLSVSN